MLVIVIGGSAAQKKRVTSMVQHCVHQLVPRLTSLVVTVKLIAIPSVAHGYCMAYSDGPRLDRPRDFVIEVERTNNLRLVLETVAHEMIHVKQYARGELYYSPIKRKYRWCGRWINYRISYWQQPWEKEAFKKEKVLLSSWLKKEGLQNRKWAIAE